MTEAPNTTLVRHAVLDSPIGPLTAVEHVAGEHVSGFEYDGGLAGLYMEGHRRGPEQEALGARVDASDSAVLTATAWQLAEYFERRRREFSIPLAPVGTPFQLRVWAVLREIPYGALSTYGALAQRLGDRSMAQAVGAANARNPLSIVVPCHRVVGSGGSLVGYAGGLARKEFLLELENPARAHAEPLF